jgi:hypothetical protein
MEKAGAGGPGRRQFRRRRRRCARDSHFPVRRWFSCGCVGWMQLNRRHAGAPMQKGPLYETERPRPSVPVNYFS